MVPTAFGIEGVTKKELKKLGYDAKAQDGRVIFEGEFKDVVRANLWIRTGNRVMIKMAEFDAYDFDTLFDKTFEVEWAEFLTKDATFPVELSSVKSTLSSVPACQSIVKKAIVEKMKKRYKIDHFPEDGPLYRIKVQILRDHVVIGLDTTGDSLNRRGYRVNISEAPLKETLAASLLFLSNWDGEIPLWDGFCGSGTIPIEGAMMAKNIAPGLMRKFAFESWKNFPVSILYEEKRIAKEVVRRSKTKVIGTDINKDSIEAAIKNAKRIGLENFIEFRVANVSEFFPHLERGYFISNLPYGKRLDKDEELYKILKKKYTDLKGWDFFFLTADRDFERKFFKANENRKMFNGRIEVRFYMYKRRNAN
ncbi:ribosomal RNA large subunit methyltransferase L [Athalassotoga saccharophila]|nr:ribosomal RNA large subunit methyltransferase L [Athalassotoga saccharophila]